MNADLGTLRDALADMTLERNAALREIERLRAQIDFVKNVKHFEPCSRVDPCKICKDMIERGEA
jgi:hypothetical protein